jgi:hypothetical protein
MIYSLKKIILGGFALSVLMNAVPYAAHAIEYGGLGIFPHKSEVNTQNPLTKAWFIYTLESSEVRYGKVDVANTSDEPIEVRIYPVDAVTTADGAFAPEPEDKQRIGVGSWVVLSASEISLRPREVKTVDFIISVPKNIEVGDHMGAIIAQGKGRKSEIEGSGLRITTRVGARIYITVPGNTIKKLSFNEFTEELQDRKVAFYSIFSNKGNVRIRLKGNIEITGSDGVLAGTAEIPEREVFPQKTITIPALWHPEDSVEGELKARATVMYGSDESLVQELTFSLPRLKKPFTLASVSSRRIVPTIDNH